MPSLFQSSADQGSNVPNVQQAVYTSVWDFANDPGEWVIDIGTDGHVGDDILDLTNPGQGVADAGVYIVTGTFEWNEVESGAAVRGRLNVATGGSGFVNGFMADLGVASPDPSGDTGLATVSGMGVMNEDAQLLCYASIAHNRATDNLTGAFRLTIVRLY